MSDPFLFRAEWPITDDTLTLRELISLGMEELPGMLTARRAYLLDPPVWTARIQMGCAPKLIAEAEADLEVNRPRLREATKPPAVCGTDSGMKRHRRRGEKPCDPCREAHNAAERDRVARRRQEAARQAVA